MVLEPSREMEIPEDRPARKENTLEILVDSNDFPASRKSTYLNSASVALMYRGGADAAIEWQEDLANNGTINFDEVAEDEVFQDLHRAAACLFEVEPDDIAVAASSTEFLCSLAWAIMPGPGTNVVSADVVFPTTLYPWARISRYTGCEIRLARGRNGYVSPDEMLSLIDDSTAVVCVSHVEYGTGQMYDLTELGEVAHDHGALLVVDATQSAGGVPIDVSGSGVDALVSAGYKWLCGPFGAAVMYLAPHLHEALNPGLIGWRSHKDMWDLRADRLELPATARRFEFSTMGYGCAVGLTRSIEYLVGVGVKRIFDHNLHLADLLIEGLRERGAEFVSPLEDSERTSIVSVQFPQADSSEVVAHLSRANVVVSLRGDFVRFSPHLYNRPEDIEHAFEELDRYLS